MTLPRTQILRGDQGKVEDLQQIVSACSRFDIIIDDGSHASYHQQLTMATLFPHLASRGLYIIEDLNSQPEPLESELPRRVKTRELVKNRAALDQAVGGVAEVHLFDAPLQGTGTSLP